MNATLRSITIQTGRGIAAVLLFFLLPAVTNAFFCNQSTLSVEWKSTGPFRIDGDGFSRGNFTVIDPGDESLVSIDKMEINDALEAEFQVTGLKPGSTQIQVRWEFTDKSDNGICELDVTVDDFPITMQNAQDIFLGHINQQKIGENEAWAFMRYEPLCPGQIISSADPDEFSETIDATKYFLWLDYGKDLRFSHYSQYLFVDVQTGDIEVQDAQWWPVIDGEPYLGGIDLATSEDRIFGTTPEPTPEPSGSTITEEGTPSTKTEVCAVLVSGTATNPRQIEAFENDVEYIRGNLTRESLGPQLSNDNIEVMNNASHQEIKDKLESFRGQYSKVYFFYSGHGTERYMVTNDTVGNRMWYVDLANALDATEADDICVIIDACHSGGAVNTFSNHEGLQDQNVTLLTSARADTSSWTRYIVTGGGDTIRTGEYTWAWSLCFGDPNADADGMNGTSILEAHDWAVAQNPTLDVGGSLVGRMDPQKWVHRAVRPVQETTTVPDVGLTVENNTDTPLAPDVQIRIDLDFEFEDTTTTDEDVFYISPKLSYDMHLVPEVDNYKIGLRFDYSSAEENYTGTGEPGVVWRDTDLDEWQDYRPTDIDTNGKTVLAVDVSRLGHFAIGEVKTEDIGPNSVGYPTSRGGYTLHPLAPNPVHGATTISYFMKYPAVVSIRILDAFGREAAVLRNTWQAGGDHALQWDGRAVNGAALSSGVYYCQISFATPSETIMLVRPLTLLKR